MSETQLGDPLVDALERMAQRLDVRDVDWVVQAIRIQQTVGGKLADLLHTLADFIRAREEIRREIDVLTAEGKVSAYVLGALPALPRASSSRCINPGYLDPMFEGWGPIWLGGAVALGRHRHGHHLPHDQGRHLMAHDPRRAPAVSAASALRPARRRPARPRPPAPTTPRSTSAASTARSTRPTSSSCSSPQPFLSRVRAARSPAGSSALLGGAAPAQLPRPHPHRSSCTPGWPASSGPRRSSAVQVLGGIVGFLLGAWLVGVRRPSAAARGSSSSSCSRSSACYAPEVVARPQGRRSARTPSAGTCPTPSTCWPSPSRPAWASRARSASCASNFDSPLADEFAPYASGDGAGPPPPGGPAEPQEAHGGAGAIELRADPDPGGRAGDAGGPGAEDLGRRRCARSASSGRGRRRPSCR